MWVHTKNSLILFSFSLLFLFPVERWRPCSVGGRPFRLCAGVWVAWRVALSALWRDAARCGRLWAVGWRPSGDIRSASPSNCRQWETNQPLGSRFHLPFVCKSSWLFPWLSLWAGCSGESDSASAAGLPAVFECEDRWLWLWCPSTACTAALHTPAAGATAVPNRSHTHTHTLMHVCFLSCMGL